MAASGEDPLAALPPGSGRRSPPKRLLGRAADLALDARQRLSGLTAGLDDLADETPKRRIAVLGLYGEEGAETMAAAVEELLRSRHEVVLDLGSLGPAHGLLHAHASLEHLSGGKLANLNRLAGELDREPDWVLLLDDDVLIGPRFLDRLVALAERFGLAMAQPALSRSSHTAWDLVRRRPAAARRTSFVEMGPALLVRGEVFGELLPFPEEGMGWGVDLHWAALAEERGWRLGVADAVPVRHDLRPPAAAYDREAAAAAAAELLSSRPHIIWPEAKTLETWRKL